MGSDKLTPLEKEAMARAVKSAQATGRYEERRTRRAPWKPFPAPQPTLKSIVWATQDVLLASFIAATGLRPIAAVDLQGQPLIGFDRMPTSQLREWESGPKGKVDLERYGEMRDRIRERCKAARAANLQTVLLRL